MEDMGDIVVVKESKCLFIGDLVGIEFRIMCMFWGLLGLKTWDRG